MTYGMEVWRPAKDGANMTAVLTRAAKLISRIHKEASHTAFFKDRLLRWSHCSMRRAEAAHKRAHTCMHACTHTYIIRDGGKAP